MVRDCWQVFDTLLDRPVSVSSFFTREQAERQIAEWEARARRGKRPDTAHLVGRMEARQVH
jgi:hypothetical protein